jgi:predicted nucleotidyltransferase
VALEDYLSDLLGTEVDLVMRDALKPHLSRRILDEVVRL